MLLSKWTGMSPIGKERVFGTSREETRAFAGRHASTQVHIDYMDPRGVELQNLPRTTGTFRMGNFPSTQYHTFGMKSCVASGAAFCEGNI